MSVVRFNEFLRDLSTTNEFVFLSKFTKFHSVISYDERVTGSL